MNNCFTILLLLIYPGIYGQTISTFAGTVGRLGYSGDGSQATLALFNEPYGVAADEGEMCSLQIPVTMSFERQKRVV